MYAFLFEVQIKQPGDHDYKPFTTLALSESTDSGKARLEAQQAAESWVNNLARSLEGTTTQLKVMTNGFSTEVECRVYYACYFTIATGSDSKVGLVNNQLGGGYVASVWVKFSNLPAWMQ